MALSMNILCAGDKLPMQREFSKIVRAIYSLPEGFWAGCIIFVIIFSLIYVMMICRRVTFLTDSKMIEYYQKNVQLK